MRTKMKLSSVFMVVLAIAMCFGGCAGKTGESKMAVEESKKSETDEKDSDEKRIDIEDIDWSIDEGIIDGERYVLLNYTNNSQYTISKFELSFLEKSNITEEEKAGFYADVQKMFELGDDDMEQLKSEKISMHTRTERVVGPGEFATNIYCYYYDGFFYLKDLNHYNLTEPDIATISYVDGEQIHTVFYDFHSKKYTADEEIREAYYWTKSELGEKIPKPEAKIVEEDGIDDESTFMFKVYGCSLEEFSDYVEKCKITGYTVEKYSYEDSYSADNEEGYNINLNYNKEDSSFDCTISGPDK